MKTIRAKLLNSKTIRAKKVNKMHLNLTMAELGIKLTKTATRIEIAMRIMEDGINEELHPVNFFIAWAIPAPVIAERLRRSGIEIDAKYIHDILSGGIINESDKYLLSLLMVEMRNDINKTVQY